MNTEKYERDILCLNGSMTKDLFEKVMKDVVNYAIIDDESIAYHMKDYNITSQEFTDVFHYIENVIEIREVGKIFETHEGFFNYKENTFEWSVMYGQGSSCMIKVIDYDTGIDEIKIDPEIKFFKILKND